MEAFFDNLKMPPDAQVDITFASALTVGFATTTSGWLMQLGANSTGGAITWDTNEGSAGSIVSRHT